MKTSRQKLPVYGFKNISPLDFSLEENRRNFQSALNTVDNQVQSNALISSPIINGKTIEGTEWFSVQDPSLSSITVGTVSYASLAHCDEALDTLLNSCDDWRNTCTSERAALIHKLGELMTIKRNELAAIIVREVGKPWAEADADVVEAIDFCHYYAELAEANAGEKLTGELLGEENVYFYEPRGVAVVIAPWNFPLAIACGMTVAALVTGNATILKPAEQSSLIAYQFAKLLLEAGVPKDVFAFLPGDGEQIGRYLVNHPSVDLICFTGSKAVGLEIIRAAAQVKAGQKNFKKVIAELGGKNAIIIDEDADLDEAIKGCLYSSFGFSGQKCSACSRILVVGSAYEPFLKRFSLAVGDIIIGPAADPSTFVGPVIDKASQDRLLEVIQQASEEFSLLVSAPTPGDGYFVPPTVFRDVPTESFLWKNELFGPVVAVSQVSSFEEGVSEAVASEYALTGGVFSRSPRNIAYARKNFRVGNLYINRGCTGAIVARQPFGGFGHSGVGSKAGGPDYLNQFTIPRLISENTMRRGFTPDLES